MSFFGFDNGPPNRGHHPVKAPGFAQTTDHFAGLPTDDDDDDGLASPPPSPHRLCGIQAR